MGLLAESQKFDCQRDMCTTRLKSHVFESVYECGLVCGSGSIVGDFPLPCCCYWRKGSRIIGQ